VRGKSNRPKMDQRHRSLKRGGCDGGGSKSGDDELRHWWRQPAMGRSRGGDPSTLVGMKAAWIRSSSHSTAGPLLYRWMTISDMGCIVPQPFATGENRSYPYLWVITGGLRYPGYKTPTCLAHVLSLNYSSTQSFYI
jgi:hypothetical protein